MSGKATTPSATPAVSFTSAYTSEFQLGVELMYPVFDVRNSNKILLIAEGAVVTEHLLAQLEKRGVTRVLMSQADLDQMRSANGKTPGEPDDASRGRLPRWEVALNRPGITNRSFVHQLRLPGPGAYSREMEGVCSRRYQELHAELEQLYGSLIRGQRVASAGLVRFCNEALDLMSQDLDYFVSEAMAVECGEYPYRHAMQTAMVAMAIGTLLGRSRDELLELGIGSLLHDVGMLFVDHTLIKSPGEIGEIEFLEVTKHPTRAFELLKSQTDLSNGSLMVAYQMHERCNGSGYPNGRHGPRIHRLARIASVADVFVALISQRPHRKAKMRYHAVDHILHETRFGLFDPEVVRALLETISLFPVGSYVSLSDGRTARVLRGNLDAYAQPTVEVLQAEGGSEPEIIDLSVRTDLQIACPVDTLEAAH